MNSVIHLYNTAAWFCTNSGAKLHPGKCVAIPTGPAPASLPNGIKVLDPTQHTTILGVPMGTTITRQQQTEKVIHNMLAKCAKWLHIGRSIEGKVTVVRAMIVSTIWYVLGALPTSENEAEKLQRVVNNYMNGTAQNDLEEPTSKGNMSSKWFYIQKRLGGWGLESISRTLKVRKLSMLRRFIADVADGKTKPWHTYITAMLEEHVEGWGKDWSAMLFWGGDRNQGAAESSQWSAISPWWRDAWHEWLRLRLKPQRNSVTRAQLRCWPVWNNYILASEHGITTALYRSFSNTDTRAHMKAIRQQGFVTFNDFMHPNGNFMSQHDLYNAITVSSSVNESEHVVPQWACGVLLRRITALWSNATRRWLLTTHATEQDLTSNWWTGGTPSVKFVNTSNKVIRASIRMLEPHVSQPKLIKVRHQHISMDWSRESSALKQLAPS